MNDVESPGVNPNPQPQINRPQNNFLKEILSTVGVLASALVLAFLLITFVFQTYQVSGVSMEQTLHNGDHLLHDFRTFSTAWPELTPA